MTELKRLADWPDHLARVIDGARNTPFTWGQNDCCLFAMDCVEAITGTDIAQPYRGYNTMREGVVLLKRCGGVTGIAETEAKNYNIPEIKPLTMQRGDVVLFDIGRGDTLGICGGQYIFAPGEDGLIGFPLEQAQRAWRIG